MIENRNLHRALELWRRQARENVATKDIMQDLLDLLDEHGFQLKAKPLPVVPDEAGL